MMRFPQVLHDEDVDRLLNWQSMVDSLDAVYHDWANGRATLAERSRTAGSDSMLSHMGGIWTAKSVASSKVYTTSRGRFDFLVTLFGLSGQGLMAVFPGQALTRWRTAAQTALVATRYFKLRSVSLAVFGAGQQGAAHVESLVACLNVREVRVCDPQFGVDQADTWSKRFKTTVVSCSPEFAVHGADLIVTATRSLEPVFKGHWLSSNALVCAIGTSSVKGTELDADTLDSASRIWVESLSQAEREAGELAHWPGRVASEMKLFDLPMLYRMDEPLAWQPGITVFKAVGNGLADTAAAWLAWQQRTHPQAGKLIP